MNYKDYIQQPELEISITNDMRDTVICNDVTQLEEKLELSIQQFQLNLAELRTAIDKNLYDNAYELLCGLNIFLDEKKPIMNDLSISIRPIVDAMVNNELIVVLQVFLDIDCQNFVENIKYYKEAMLTIALLSSYHPLKFSPLLSMVRLYLTIFQHFIDTTEHPCDDDLLLFYLASLINLSYYERKESDAFTPFEMDSYEITKQFIDSFQQRNVNQIKRGDVSIRVFTEIARKHAHFFDATCCQLIYQFIQTQNNRECLFTVLEFATFVMKTNGFILMDYFELFSTELSILSSYPSNFHKQGMIFLSILIKEQENPQELASIFLNVPVGLIIRDGIRDSQISQTALEFAKVCASCSFPALDTCFKQESVWAFQLLLPYWNNTMESFLVYVTQTQYKFLPIESKKSLIELIDILIANSHEAQHFIQTSFDFEEIGNLLDSGDSAIEIIDSTLKLIRNCLLIAYKKSEDAFDTILYKLNEALIPDSINLLLENEDPVIQDHAKQVLNLVNELTNPQIE